MSGGFFRGTSADQDTRFSNKQAKLMKSQKFAPELENLVDITKVKMDVMRPWIAHRVTELLGFEDEVLINFIYGLLEGKEVNGKEIQISLTGFMEKNTGKFMKELWVLLLSAQKNASGVPQQFLDAKEEETRKKMAETERITNEIQKRKEKENRELELERMKKMDVEVDISRANDAALDRGSKHQPRDSNTRSADDKETNGRNGSRGRSRVSRSPRSAERSSSPLRRRPSRSISKSVSKSRSRSNERHRSRSISRSPQPRRGRSISSENALTSPKKRSVSPRSRDTPRRSPSPRRRLSHYRRRSPSPVRRRLRSPIRRRSRSPIHRRSRSPIRRRSRPPIRYRSRTPVRRRSRSPIRPRSPSPGRRRSPSPVRRRYRRSPSTPRRRSVSPVRRRPTVGGRRRSPTPPRRGSRSPQEWSSQSPPRRTPPSPVRRSPKRQRRSPMQSPRDRIRTLEKRSPVRRAPPRDKTERPVETRKGPDSLVLRPPVSLRSPQRDSGDRNDPRSKLPALSPSPYKSPSLSESPPADRKRSPSEDRRSVSPNKSLVKQTKERVIHDDSPSPPRKSRELKPIRGTPEASVEDEEANHARDGSQKFKSSEKRSIHSSVTRVHKDSAEKVHYKDKYSPERLTSHRSGETRSRQDNIDLRKKDQETKSKTLSGKARYPEVSQPEPPTTLKGTLSSERVKEPYLGEGHKGDVKVKGSVSKLPGKVERNEQIGSVDSGSEESDRHRSENNEKRKLRKSKRQEVTSDDDYSDDDSQIEGRKEAKKRRKEEKRLKKEERRRRREERRRRREERRSEKLKLKTAGAVAPASDLEKDNNSSDLDRMARKGSHSSDVEETESEQKKLEIELREKALESLRAKKGVGN